MQTSLTIYFDKRANQRAMLREIVEGTFPISLRLLDWFVTHYAKHRQIVYWIAGAEGATTTISEAYPGPDTPARKFNLYLEYRAQLKSYSKQAFDPFRRHNRITFVVTANPLVVVETTVGQLNFFRWAFQNHVIDYILRHTTDIEEDMARYSHERRAQPKKAAAPAVAKPTPVRARPAKAVPAVVRRDCMVSFD